MPMAQRQAKQKAYLEQQMGSQLFQKIYLVLKLAQRQSIESSEV